MRGLPAKQWEARLDFPVQTRLPLGPSSPRDAHCEAFQPSSGPHAWTFQSKRACPSDLPVRGAPTARPSSQAMKSKLGLSSPNAPALRTFQSEGRPRPGLPAKQWEARLDFPIQTRLPLGPSSPRDAHCKAFQPSSGKHAWNFQSKRACPSDLPVRGAPTARPSSQAVGSTFGPSSPNALAPRTFQSEGRPLQGLPAKQ